MLCDGKSFRENVEKYHENIETKGMGEEGRNRKENIVPLFYYCYDAVRPCFCRTGAANKSTVHPPNNTRVNTEQPWIDNGKGKPKKNLFFSILSTTSPTRAALGPRRRDVNDYLSVLWHSTRTVSKTFSQ
jgi:hypothetical protein